MKTFSCEMYAARCCMQLKPVTTTKWRVEAESIEEATKKFEKIRNKLARGTAEIQFMNVKEED